MALRRLPVPEPGAEVSWVGRHLAHLIDEESGAVARSHRWSGTQHAADTALDHLDIAGYAQTRQQIWPAEARGATGLSPWIRHGMITLPLAWRAVSDAPAVDRQAFRHELAWQEYARHLRARLGTATNAPLRALPSTGAEPGVPWDTEMVCVSENLDELRRDGWMVNQARMWLASLWTVRRGGPWREGEDLFFRHLLDGSRAANQLGWQWVIGSATGRPYGVSRHQVEQRSPGWCQRCPHAKDCPIEQWPSHGDAVAVEAPTRLRVDNRWVEAAGPETAQVSRSPDTVWLTAESLGRDDPALSAHPELPVVFVFDEPLLSGLRLSGKRLVFLADRLAELGTTRALDIMLGSPAEALASRHVAVTFAPVPGFRRLIAARTPAVLHPWPWLVRPSARSAASFSAWWKGHQPAIFD